MKKIMSYLSSVCFSILLSSSMVNAQSGSEVKLNLMDHPLTTNKNLVSISTAVDSKQSSSEGIHFTLILKNNSGKAAAIKNIADQLSISLYNERGLDISVPNSALEEINRGQADRKWKFRSGSVVPYKMYINGKEEKINLKTQEYFEIPAGGNLKVDLKIQNVKQVETAKDVHDKILKPTKGIASGKYKLKLFLSVFSKDRSKSGGFIANFQSPMIDIDYTR